MSWFEAIILGIIQGLTEFLPVSSSGHLEIVKALFGNDRLPEESELMTVVLHFATALSTLVVFRKEVTSIVLGLFKGNKEDTQFSMNIIISMIPAGIAGVLFDDLIETFFDSQILLVGFMLFVTGILLFMADKAKKTDKTVTLKTAFIIGVAQMIAILPGISRSGATISTSVMLGIDRSKAASFSFLMVVPLIFGKMAKDVVDGKLSFDASETFPLIAGFIVTFIVGLLACTWMISLVRKAKLQYFAYYCFAVGLVAVIYQLIFAN